MEFIHCQEYDPTIVIGGSVKYAELLNMGLIEIGHKTTSYARSSVFVGISNPSIKSKGALSGMVPLIREVLKSWNPGSPGKNWIVHHPVMGFISLFAKRKRLVYVCHGPWSDEAAEICGKSVIDSIMNASRRRLQRAVINGSSDTFFLSKYMQVQVGRSLNISERQRSCFKLITPIVDSVDKVTYRGDVDNAMTRNGIYICRRLVKRTGVGDFLEKLGLSSHKERLDILIAGDGPEKANIEQIISKYGLTNCRLLGFIDNEDHRQNFLQSSFMLMPSLANEGFGLVLIESISHGCIPIVSQDAGGGRDWMQRIFPQLVYDGTIDGLVSSLEYAELNRGLIQRELAAAIKCMTKEEAAKTIEKACMLSE